MKPFKICDGLYQIGGPEITAPEDCCVYLLDGGGELAIIDAGLGYSAPDLIGNLKKLALDPACVKYLVATHGHIDHTGGLAYLKEKLQAKVVAHERELPAVEINRVVAAGVGLPPRKLQRMAMGTGETWCLCYTRVASGL